MSINSKKAIICDLDGTIALDHKRSHHLHNKSCPTQAAANGKHYGCSCESKDRNWDEYFDACDTDTPCDATISTIELFWGFGYPVYILSGRSMSAHKKTIQWLRDYSVQYSYLQMRSENDRTDDHVLKLHWAKDVFGLTPDNVLFVLEDRQRVVDMWRANGYRCFQVAAGNF